MTVNQSLAFNIQQFTDNGAPLVGGRLYTYAYGTTTFKTAYTDAAGLVAHTYTSDGSGGQYIALNSRGEFAASAGLYLTVGAYDIALKRSDGSTVWTRRAESFNAQEATLTTFAAPNGSSYIGFLQDGVGAVSTNVYSKLKGGFINPADFGAVGDGITDDTSALQLCINFAAQNKFFIYGGGKKYRVSTVNFLTGQRVFSLNLESIGGASSFQAVAQIDGSTISKSDMHFIDVSVNGRRDLFTNVNITAGEDGGLHAWRVICGASGGVNDILWENCDGINSATAGLAIHCTNPSTTVANYPFKNLKWIGGKLTGNREHGWFADSFDGLTLVDVDCRNNGKDLNTSDALTHGNRGARSGGYLFGAGFDIESYGPNYVGSLWKNLTLRGLNCTDSATPSLFFNPISTDVSGYAPHIGTFINDCKFDKGSASGSDRAPNTNYSLNILGTISSTGYPYIDLIANGNYFYGAPPQFNGVKGLSVNAGFINSSTNKANVYNCLYYDISAASNANGIDVFPVVNPILTRTQGTATSTIASQSTVRKFSVYGGAIKYHIEGLITGASNADGDLIYTTTSPIAGMILGELDCSARSPAGASVSTTSSVDVSGVGTFLIDTVNSSSIYYKLVLTIYPNN